MATIVETALAVTQEALSVAAGGASTSVLLDQAIRVARLRGDGENLTWLTLEARSVFAGDEATKQRVWDELTQLMPSDRFRELHRSELEAYIEARQVSIDGEERIIAMSVGEMEARIEGLSAMGEIPKNLPAHAAEQVFDERAPGLFQAALLREILARVRNRIVEFLTKTEIQLLLDVTVSGIFERNRIYVDGRLAKLAPEAAAKLLSAYRRSGEDDNESRSHALTSVRRALRAVADEVLPARDEPVVGLDGVARELTADKWINRLLQYVDETASEGASRTLLLDQIEDLGRRLAVLRDLSSKGVHSEVTGFEVNQCVIQTYLTIGDLMRLGDAEETLGK